MSQPFFDTEIPEEIAAELARFRDDEPVADGAICGAIGAGTVVLIVDFLPAVYLAWELSSSWRSLAQPAIVLMVWIIAGAAVGSATLWILSVTIASSKESVLGAKRGFLWGCACGAVVGATCASLIVRSPDFDFLEMVLSGRATGTSITLAMVFSTLGSLLGAIWMRGVSPTREIQTNGNSASQLGPATVRTDGRFQFGILRILVLTAVIAVVIAIPVHIVRRLLEIPQLESFGLEFTLLVAPLTLLELIFVVWLVMRGPLLFTRLREAIARHHGMPNSGDELKRYLARRKNSPHRSSTNGSAGEES